MQSCGVITAALMFVTRDVNTRDAALSTTQERNVLVLEYLLATVFPCAATSAVCVVPSANRLLDMGRPVAPVEYMETAFVPPQMRPGKFWHAWKDFQQSNAIHLHQYDTYGSASRGC